jgi:hypothetical protein
MWTRGRIRESWCEKEFSHQRHVTRVRTLTRPSPFEGEGLCPILVHPCDEFFDVGDAGVE